MILAACSTGLQAAVSVTDDTGRQVTLERPAQRIVSLAPHITEQLFAAGAGAKVVGVVNYSNYPPEAMALPVVGGYNQISLEAVLQLRPDLVVGWADGNPPETLQRLQSYGIPVFLSQPARLEAVAGNLRKLGRLAGSEAQGEVAAAEFMQTLQRLRDRYSQRPKLRVFYEVWNDPLMTVNDEQLISDVIRLCGGENVFADLPTLSAQISVEGVLAADPQVIIASGMGDARPEWLDDWLAWPGIQAVQHRQLYFVNPDLLHRHAPRILLGAQQVCEQLEQARAAIR